jgi:transposase
LSASFTPLKALDPTLVSQLKETLPAALFEKLNGSLSIDQDRLKFAEYKNRVLEERLRLIRIEMKPPWESRCTMVGEKITRLTSGNTAIRLGREREGPKRFLGNFEGILQSDGYGAYDQIGGPKIVHAACWAHARRKFIDAVKLNPKDTTSIQIVAQMDELFAIDAQARQEGSSQIDRHVLRLEKSQPLLEQIKAAIQAARTGALPKSALVKACDYTLTLWSRLSRFLEYPELELSNNLAENAMRPVALGRRNWIHIGSQEAGPRVAAIISIVETCRRLSLPLRDYLGSVLPGLADFPRTRVGELTPNAWAARV